MAEQPKTYWNGEPVQARRGTAVVAPAPTFPSYWATALIGQRIPVVEVILDLDDGFNYYDYLDNREGQGWTKVTNRGLPNMSHASVAIEPLSFEPAPAPEFHEVTQAHTEAGTGWGVIGGDCMRAAIASALSVPIEAVPHFGLFAEGWWGPALVAWLTSWDIGFTVYTDSEADATYWLQFTHEVRTIRSRPTDRILVANGPSPRGPWGHAVVWRGDAMVWDVHPSRDGLASAPTEYWELAPAVADHG